MNLVRHVWRVLQTPPYSNGEVQHAFPVCRTEEVQAFGLGMGKAARYRMLDCMYSEHGRDRMGQGSDRRALRVETSDETIRTWANRPYVSNALRDQLVSADVLLVPTEDSDRVFFPSGTESFLRFLQASERKGMSVDICIGDKDYQELALYADWLILADLVVRDVAAPVIVYLICDYIEQRVGKRAQMQVKSKITVEDAEAGRSVQIDYEGPASEYREVATEALGRGPKALKELNNGQTDARVNDRIKDHDDARKG